MIQSRQRGFSLVELLCATAVGAVVVLAAAWMLARNLADYERLGGGMAAEREARAALKRIADDLATLHAVRPMAIVSGASTWPSDRLGFSCLMPAAAQSPAGCIGDLTAVRYQLAERRIAGRFTRCLVRGVTESRDAFAALHGGALGDVLSGRPDDEPLAFDVVAFAVRPLARDGSGKWCDWTLTGTEPPQALDLTLVVARRTLAAKLRTPADWDGAGERGNLLGAPAAMAAHPELEVYSSVVEIRHANLP